MMSIVHCGIAYVLDTRKLSTKPKKYLLDKVAGGVDISKIRDMLYKSFGGELEDTVPMEKHMGLLEDFESLRSKYDKLQQMYTKLQVDRNMIAMQTKIEIYEKLLFVNGGESKSYEGYAQRQHD